MKDTKKYDSQFELSGRATPKSPAPKNTSEENHDSRNLNKDSGDKEPGNERDIKTEKDAKDPTKYKTLDYGSTGKGNKPNT